MGWVGGAALAYKLYKFKRQKQFPGCELGRGMTPGTYSWLPCRVEGYC